MRAAGEETRFLKENGFLELRMLYGNMNRPRHRTRTSAVRRIEALDCECEFDDDSHAIRGHPRSETTK